MSKEPKEFSYLKLGTHASTFHDTISGISISNEQVLRYNTADHGHIDASPNVVNALKQGHLLRSNEDDFNESMAQVIHEGRGVEHTTINNGKKVPKVAEMLSRKDKKSIPSEDVEVEDEEIGLTDDEVEELAVLSKKENLTKSERKRKAKLESKSE